MSRQFEILFRNKSFAFKIFSSNTLQNLLYIIPGVFFCFQDYTNTTLAWIPRATITMQKNKVPKSKCAFFVNTQVNNVTMFMLLLDVSKLF